MELFSFESINQFYCMNVMHSVMTNAGFFQLTMRLWCLFSFKFFFSSPFLLTFWLANVSCCIYRVQYRLAIKYVFAPNKKRYVSSASIFSSVSLFSLSYIIRSITVNIDVFFLLWLVSHNYIYFKIYPYSCHHYMSADTLEGDKIQIMHQYII